MADALLLSVIIPTFERLDLLAQCLDRLAPGAQTLSADRYEVIVTDDGRRTTAESLLAEKYPWARWTAGPRRGPASNRNHGARLARGLFVVFTDDDCLPAPHWLAAYASTIADGTDVYEGRTTCSQGILTPLDEAPVNLSGNNFWSCNLMIRRSAFDALGGFDEDFPSAWCEDIEIAERIKRRRLGCRFVPDALIDHPARRRVTDWAAGRRWKNRVLLWYKQGHTTPAWKWLPVHLLKVRLSQLRDFPFSGTTLRAFWSIGGEAACVLWNLRAWEAEYRRFGSPSRRAES